MPGAVSARRTQESKTDTPCPCGGYSQAGKTYSKWTFGKKTTHVKHQEIQVVVGLVISF